jgi:hypothetical protein
MNDRQTIDLTLRITCENHDVARFIPTAATSRAICRAVAEALGLEGRFHVALDTIAWPTREEADTDNAVPRP